MPIYICQKRKTKTKRRVINLFILDRETLPKSENAIDILLILNLNKHAYIHMVQTPVST